MYNYDPDNFDRSAFSCPCGCGFDTMDFRTKEIIDYLTRKYGVLPTIHSACRCNEHNKRVGGSKHSFHKKARALDFHFDGICNKRIYQDLDEEMKGYGGIGFYSWGIHMDTRKVIARWGHIT